MAGRHVDRDVIDRLLLTVEDRNVFRAHLGVELLVYLDDAFGIQRTGTAVEFPAKVRGLLERGLPLPAHRGQVLYGLVREVVVFSCRSWICSGLTTGRWGGRGGVLGGFARETHLALASHVRLGRRHRLREAFDGVHARAAPAARATSVVKFKKTTLQSYSSS